MISDDLDQAPRLGLCSELLFADRLVMGSLNLVNITAKGGRILTKFSAGQPVD